MFDHTTIHHINSIHNHGGRVCECVMIYDIFHRTNNMCDHLKGGIHTNVRLHNILYVLIYV